MFESSEYDSSTGSLGSETIEEYVIKTKQIVSQMNGSVAERDTQELIDQLICKTINKEDLEHRLVIISIIV